MTKRRPPKTEAADDRSTMARAMDWVTRIMTVCFSMILPALIGYFVDQWMGTGALFVFLGMVFGLVAGLYLLMKLVKSLEFQDNPSGSESSIEKNNDGKSDQT